MSTIRPEGNWSQTKIVATVGPACAEKSQLVELIHAGVDVFRVNTAHGSQQEHEQRVADIRHASRRAGRLVAILVDLAGPKIRLGQLPDDQLNLQLGDEVRIVRGSADAAPGQLTTSYESLLDELQIGDRVMLADGTVGLVVERIEPDAAVCRVLHGGVVRSRQGVNLPGVKLRAPALSREDQDKAIWAAQSGVDFIGLSFVRSAEDVRQLQSLVQAENGNAQVIAKIEKPEALQELDEIVRATDGIMVARGDLGVEIDISRVPVVQKKIIRLCHRHQKPVIVATQMLDSMQHSRIPTRAEATDVANAIIDGADACMLSGETAIGRYPREAVEMMHRIAVETESLLRSPTGPRAEQAVAVSPTNPITSAVTWAAGRLAEQLDARLIVVASAQGRSARSLSTYRLFMPTVGVSDSEVILRRMCLYWGVAPLPDAPTDNTDRLVDFVVEKGRSEGYLHSGDRIVVITGTGLQVGQHNTIIVHEVE